ncbi:5-dehydro-2-deoxygluconokinase [Alicyclobacillus dauci]|uniref:5-dehydro-2-deoxygluconokinase n=1 Tax=Alicyclobacillus dauci TaxID=1475485 RepID=A0ABY6Z5R4_9BACL|nr:5-dehydro-2-deoxygluconokinase [Alicyclobacillus dauci]WAH37957.1 5-dehydro-2-deoxygluconokinase [Alicyclobacillus dauci]
MGRPEVYTLGRLIVDLYANDIGVPMKDVNSFNKYLGGSAGNTAVGLARHGANVGMISRVGKDGHGQFLKETLIREGVNTRMVHEDPNYPTGLAFAAITPPSDSTVLFYRKPCADANIEITDLDREALGKAKILVVACTALAVAPGRDAALEALEYNRSTGGVNVLDIDWRPQFWTNESEASLYYRLALRLADVVIANEPELEFVGGGGDPLEACRNVLAYGPQQVVAKRGGEGVLYVGPEGVRNTPAFKVDVLNTLGAGDAFGAGYTYGLLQSWEVERRLEYACASGAIVVSRHSCAAAMPTNAEVEDLISSKAIK